MTCIIEPCKYINYFAKVKFCTLKPIPYVTKAYGIKTAVHISIHSLYKGAIEKNHTTVPRVFLAKAIYV
jgi:hypothetical protein